MISMDRGHRSNGVHTGCKPWSGVKLLRFIVILGVVGMSTFGCTNPPSGDENSSPVPVQNNGTPPTVPDDRGTSNPNPGPSTSVLPKTNEQGDYVGKSNHLDWQVVDPDPNGLNCRMGDRAIDEVWSPAAGALDINSWPVKGTLKLNQQFQAGVSPGGFVITFDAQQNPWIYVESSEGEGTSDCFVRANEKFIQPVTPGI